MTNGLQPISRHPMSIIPAMIHLRNVSRQRKGDAIGTGRCPTCGQSLPEGLSRAQLERKIAADRNKAMEAQRSQLRRIIEADLRRQLWSKARSKARQRMHSAVATAKRDGRREGRAEIDMELKTLRDDLRAARQQQDVAELARRQAEGTARKLQQKLSNASPQGKGLLSQEQIQRSLQAACPDDAFPATQPGRRGADILQTIRGNGHVYGKILWEIKETSENGQKHIWPRRGMTANALAPTTSVS